MNKEIEEKFVKNFIFKDNRERINFELSSLKKRAMAIQKIYNLIDKKFAVWENANVSYDDVISIIKTYFNISKNCYVISETSDDGKIMPFPQAIENMLRYEVNYVIICDDNTVLVSEEYNTFNPPNIIILHRNNNS